jgi:hypothetical protein
MALKDKINALFDFEHAIREDPMNGLIHHNRIYAMTIFSKGLAYGRKGLMLLGDPKLVINLINAKQSMILQIK